MERISSTLIGKFHNKLILFHAFPQVVDKQKWKKKLKIEKRKIKGGQKNNSSIRARFRSRDLSGKKKIKLKSKKTKEGREATLLSESGFDPETCKFL